MTFDLDFLGTFYALLVYNSITKSVPAHPKNKYNKAIALTCLLSKYSLFMDLKCLTLSLIMLNKFLAFTRGYSYAKYC